MHRRNYLKVHRAGMHVCIAPPLSFSPALFLCPSPSRCFPSSADTNGPPGRNSSGKFERIFRVPLEFCGIRAERWNYGVESVPSTRRLAFLFVSAHQPSSDSSANLESNFPNDSSEMIREVRLRQRAYHYSRTLCSNRTDHRVRR